MTTYSVAQAKARLPELIDRARNGEEVIITRRGEPMVALTPRGISNRAPTDYGAIAAFLATQPMHDFDSAALVHAMRDED